jgi:hypothetical protein
MGSFMTLTCFIFRFVRLPLAPIQELADGVIISDPRVLVANGNSKKVRSTVWLLSGPISAMNHWNDVEGALFRPVNNNRTGRLDRHLDPASVYQNIVRKYGLETGLSAEVMGLCVHSLRATAATNALSHGFRYCQGSGVAWAR